MVYHGGENNISSFITYHQDSEVGDMYGAYFTKDKKYAKTYNKGTLYEVFLNIREPLTTEGSWTGIINKDQVTDITAKHDGIVNDKFDNGILYKLHLAKTRTEIIVFNPNQIKSATDNNGDFSTTDDNIQAYVNNYYIPLDDAEEAEVLRHDLFGKFKNKSLFGCIGRTANYWYLCDYFGDSTYRVRAQVFIDGNEQFINAFEREIRNETFRSPEDFNRRFEAFRDSRGKHYNGWSNATLRITNNGDAGVAVSKLQDSQDADQGGSNGQSSIHNAKSQIATFTTPQGEIYGFVDKAGNIYLDETQISPEHPIHEYTHLWDRAVQQRNPGLWKRIVELAKQTSLWL